MKLNIGCGDRYADGWHNVDHQSPHRKDEVVDLAGPLPWAAGSVTHAYAGHVLEHLERDTAAELLARLLPCMTPGGLIMVVGPDVGKAQEMIDAGTFDYRYGHTLDSIKHGGYRWPGDEHRWECDAPAVGVMLRQAGWAGVTEVGIRNVPSYWPVADRAPLWQCAVGAIAPYLTTETPA